MSGPEKNQPRVSPLTVANGQLGKALKRTSHKVSLQQTGKTWNSEAIYTNFSIPENEIQNGYCHGTPWVTVQYRHPTFLSDGTVPSPNLYLKSLLI